MVLHSFCGILTLQVGVAMLAVVFWTIAVLTFVVNFFEFIEADEFPLYSLTITTFVILLIMGGLIAFFSAYNESNGLCMAGVALTALTTVVWVTVSSFSFYNDDVFLKFVCVHDRCPETFWLAPLKYRLEEAPYENKNESLADISFGNITIQNNSTQHNSTSKRKKRVIYPVVLTPLELQHHNVADIPFGNITQQNNSTQHNSTSKRKKRVIYPVVLTPLELQHHNVVMNETEFHKDALWSPELDEALYYLDDNVDDEPNTNDEFTVTGYNFGLPLIGAVTLFICNFFFFLFSILVLWSYGQELAWTNEYLSDIPEYASP